MQRCAICKQGRLKKGKEPASVSVAGHAFTAQVPALLCVRCGEVFFDGPSLGRLELRAAEELAKAGKASGEVLRFMRKALGLRAVDLAELLDVTAETLSRWETGKLNIERRAMALLAALVRERVEGHTTTLESLEALKAPKKLARKVDLGPLAT